MKIKKALKIFLIENGVLHSFSIKNIFYDKMDVKLLYIHVTI